MNAPDKFVGRLWGLSDMLRSSIQIYQLALLLQKWRSEAEIFKASPTYQFREHEGFSELLGEIQRICQEHGLLHTSDLARRAIGKEAPKTHTEVFSVVDSLNDSLSSELEKEAVFRIHPARKDYFERDDLFGTGVATAFQSCARDIQRAGSCYALEQEDACVHHLMLVLERGLKALAGKVGVTFQHANWQVIINEIEKKLKSSLPGTERDFYNEVNAQFGFLKNAYRNHSQHAHDDPYDMEIALSILIHVRAFMQELAKGGLSE